MSTVLRLEGGGETIDLYPLIKPSVAASGIEALAEIVGFGLAPVSPRWYDGAGAGSTYRGSRILSRPIDLPLYAYAASRADLNARLGDLAIVFDPANADPARLYFGMPDDTEWYLDVIRESGGDWKRKVDSDDSTYFKTTLSLTAGNPFWTRSEPDSFVVTQSADKGLLPDLAQLQVSSGAAFGLLTVNNSGNAPAWPFWTVNGPATHFVFTGADGEIIEWNGTLADDKKLFIDARYSTVIDEDGVNHYSELSTAPRFWPIKRGSSQVTVALEGGSIGHIVDTGTESVRNLFTNPSFETAAGTVTVRTNYNTNPRMANSTAGWVAVNGAGQTPTISGTQVDFASGALNGAGFFYQSAAIPAAPSDNWGGSLEVSVPAGYPAISLVLRTYAYGANITIADSGIVVVNPGETRTITSGSGLCPAGTNGIRTIFYAGAAIPTGARLIIRNGLAENSMTVGPYFDGSTAASGDFTYVWTGTADASTSQKRAPIAAGSLANGSQNGYGIQSSEWAAAGSKSLRLMRGSSTIGFAYLGNGSSTIPVVDGGFYTLVVTGRIAAAQTGSGLADARNRAIGMRYPQGSELVNGPQLPNAPGAQELRWSFKVPAGRTTAYVVFYQGVNVVGDVWWDKAALVPIPDLDHPYTGPAFDGSTTGLTGFIAHWDTTADASQSYLTISKLVGKTTIDCQWFPRVWGVV